MSKSQIQLIGVGSLCEALVTGWLTSGFLKPAQLALIHRSPERARRLAERWPGIQTATHPLDIENVILAVRPVDIEKVCRSLQSPSTEQTKNIRVVSTAAGVSIAQLESWLPNEARVIRAMPNLPVSVGFGQTAIAGTTRCSNDDLNWAHDLFDACGTAIQIDEELFPVFTATLGSGPGLLLYVVNAMIDAAIAEGIDSADADQLMRQLMYGTGAVLCAGDQTVSDLLNEVVVPGGTTEAGLASLESNDVAAAIAAAVSAAAERSRRLSQG